METLLVFKYLYLLSSQVALHWDVQTHQYVYITGTAKPLCIGGDWETFVKLTINISQSILIARVTLWFRASLFLTNRDFRHYRLTRISAPIVNYTDEGHRLSRWMLRLRVGRRLKCVHRPLNKWNLT